MKTFLTFAVTVFLAALATSQGKPGASEMDPEIAEMVSTNAPPKGFATRLDYIKSFTTAKAIEIAYRSGKITKTEAMLAWAIDRVGPNDKDPMDTYGKVVDQDGQPVVGAKVRGFLRFEGPGDSEEHDTKTDKDGRFHFLGLHGGDLGIVPEKEGYEYNRDKGFEVLRPENYLPNPNHPLIFTMWKLRGGEPMSHALIYSSVPWDGRFKRFDLHSFRPEGADTNGELMIKVTRGILITNRNFQHFAWVVTLEITNGGLLATKDPYPYNAPMEGYQSSVTLDCPTNFFDWGNRLHQGYYFNSKGGQIYGRMDIRMGPEWNHASLRADIYANVTGSRNLEHDSASVIITREQRKMWPLIWPNESSR